MSIAILWPSKTAQSYPKVIPSLLVFSAMPPRAQACACVRLAVSGGSTQQPSGSDAKAGFCVRNVSTLLVIAPKYGIEIRLPH
jgi:hypothetical protein